MNKIIYIIIAIMLIGCGGGGGSTSNTNTNTTSSNTLYTGYFIDAPVNGLEYIGNTNSGVTGTNGEFTYYDDENITFKIGNVVLGTKAMSKNTHIITPTDMVENGSVDDVKVVQILKLLQTLDTDKNNSTIDITKAQRENLAQKTKIDLSQNSIDDNTLAYICDTNTTSVVTDDTAKNHYENTITNIKVEDYPKDKTYTSIEQPTTIIYDENYTLIAWNDLGMHCMDDNYSVFSILPPYNTLKAHLINKYTSKNVSSNVNITFESTISLDNKTNTTSTTKTDFWSFVLDLFNIQLENDTGLKGYKTPNTSPQKLVYNSTYGYWEAEGIPITPYNDDNTKSYYQMVKVVAKDTNNKPLATTQTVLPVSDEMDCKSCHSSQSTSNDAKPSSGWVNHTDTTKDYKLNILKLHDQKHNISAYISELQTKGYDYNSSLYETAQTKPILCAVCHKSNALGTTGIGNISSLSTALHTNHQSVKSVNSTLALNDITNRDSCYSCHPGKNTKCLRGAMGKSSTNNNYNINCQECHGNFTNLSNTNREPWLDEPDCQSCHQKSTRYTSVFVDNFKTLRTVQDKTFATQDNAIGTKNLYRYSKGHGSLQCETCHGSTHAIYPSSQTEDNIQSMNIQGYVGTISDCKACHTNTKLTPNKGPHGLHSISQEWVNKHGDYVEDNKSGLSECRYCHGADDKGSFLSKTFSARTFKIEHKTKTYKAGDVVSCYDCHNGAKDD